MTPDRQLRLVEDFRVRLGAVIDHVYATIAATATTEEEVQYLHRRLMGNVMMLAASMHKLDFGGQETDFLILAKQARLCMEPEWSEPR